MSAVLGALLLAVTVVLYRWAFIHHRRPVRSRWARNGAASMLVQFVILLTLSAGICLAIQFLLTLHARPPTAVEAGAVLAIIAAAVAVLRALNRQWRRFQAEAPLAGSDADPSQVPANDSGAALPPSGGLAGGRPRQAS